VKIILKTSLIITIFLSISLITGCTSKNYDFDIRGTWDITLIWGDNAPTINYTSTLSGLKRSGPIKTTISFFGDAKGSGNWTDGFGQSGTYSVSDKTVSWTYPSYQTYSGTSTDKDHMNGSMIEMESASGTWKASRK